jgi:HK97 family phage prohead protease
MSDQINRNFAAEITEIEGSRDVLATITTDAVDRDGEVILPRGVDLGNYRKNPVVLWSHNPDVPPVGKALWIKPTPNGRGLVARVQFATTDEARDVCDLYKEGFLSGFSVGFRPLESGPPTDVEIKARPELAGVKRVHRKAELLEFSAVAIPCNPEALVVAKALRSTTIQAEVDKAMSEGSGTGGGYATDDDGDGDGDKPMPKEKDDAETPEHMKLKAGQYVEWGKGMKAGCGKIVSIHKSGKVPGVAEDVEGTEDDPAAKVKCYKAVDGEDGKFRPTERCMGHKCRDLTKVPHPLDADGDGDEDGDRLKAVVLPPHRTLAQVEADLIARASQHFDPIALAERSAALALDRHIGAV